MGRATRTVNILYHCFDEIDAFPRGDNYVAKTVVCEHKTKISGTEYFRRDFADGSAELVRYDFGTGKWVFLLFKSENADTA